MATTNVGALTGAEEEIFAYLLTALSGTRGQDAFKGAMPACHESWFFAINGGPDPSYADGTKTRPWPSWILNAEIGGWFAERTGAQALIELMFDALPAGLYRGDVSMAHVQVVRLDSIPTLDLVTKEFKGEKFYVWELTAQLQVVLNAVTV